MHDGRDYGDLKNDKIAVYNFRGYTVLKFNKETKQLEIGKYADMCCFIGEDIKLMSFFLEQCHLFNIGVVKDVQHVSVD